MTIIISLLLVFVVGNLIKINYKNVTEYLPIQQMPGSKVLHKYKNHSFVSNFHGTYVNYFTDYWARMSSPSNPENFLKDNRYAWEKDIITNKEKYGTPSFAFILNFVDPHCTMNIDMDKYQEKIFKDCLLVEKGEGFWIFDLRKTDKDSN